jgi:hypothetical protein
VSGISGKGDESGSVLRKGGGGEGRAEWMVEGSNGTGGAAQVTGGDISALRRLHLTSAVVSGSARGGAGREGRSSLDIRARIRRAQMSMTKPERKEMKGKER